MSRRKSHQYDNIIVTDRDEPSGSVFGGVGDDFIFDGGASTDYVLGGNAGDDRITSVGGDDILRAGRGDDTMIVQDRIGTVEVHGGSGYDRLILAGTGYQVTEQDDGSTIITDGAGFQIIAFDVEGFLWGV